MFSYNEHTAGRPVFHVRLPDLDPATLETAIGVIRTIKQTDAIGVVVHLDGMSVPPCPSDFQKRLEWSKAGQLFTRLIECGGIPFIAEYTEPLAGVAAEVACACHYRIGPSRSLDPAGSTSQLTSWGTLSRCTRRMDGQRLLCSLVLGNLGKLVNELFPVEIFDLETLTDALAKAPPMVTRNALLGAARHPLKSDRWDFLETTLFANCAYLPPPGSISFKNPQDAINRPISSTIAGSLDDFAIDFTPFDSNPDNEIDALSRKNRIGEVELLLDQNMAPIQGRCIELGSAAGYFSCLASRHESVTEVIALDISVASILRWGPVTWTYVQPDWSKLTFRVADFNDLEEEVGSFDTVIFCASLHHSSDIPKSLAVAYRLLRPGGSLILHGEHYDPTFFRSKGSRASDGQPHTIGDFKRLLRPVGFEPKVFRFRPPNRKSSRHKVLYDTPIVRLLNGRFKFCSFCMLGTKR